MPVKIHLIAAARPNFMKIAPLYRALKKRKKFAVSFVHTGQHYDFNMSEIFLQQLGLPAPDVSLNIGSGTHAQQTAGVLEAYEKYLLAHRPDWVIVAGDVNSTLACTLVAKKLGICVAHLEAGLRSFDSSMPEEINRVLTDAIADVLWTPSPDGDLNLLREGRSRKAIKQVGNIMIDSLMMLKPVFEKLHPETSLNINGSDYGIVTIHRPSNVDDPQRLEQIFTVLERISAKVPLILPLHPRTKKQLTTFKLWERFGAVPGLRITEPLGYMEFMSLLTRAKLVMTDSGGVQEETTYLNIPCLTLRENTERPVTVTQGTNALVSADELEDNVGRILKGKWKKARVPKFWDGKTAERVTADLLKRCKKT